MGIDDALLTQQTPERTRLTTIDGLFVAAYGTSCINEVATSLHT
jgi:hypothetical protein